MKAISPRVLFLFVFVLVFELLVTQAAYATVSVNVPIGNWSYEAIAKLKALGLIHSDMRGTRPWTRLEMARLIAEADEQFENLSNSEEESSSNGRSQFISAILGRLKGEFRTSLDAVSGTGEGASSYIKPIEDLYLHYYHGNNDFDLENDKGQELAEGSNLRIGLSTHGAFWGHLAYYFNPEWRYSENQFGGDDDEFALLEGYGKLEFFNIELQVGRDSLWWGTGYHGSMILTDNAKPFDLIKVSTPEPVVLPWIFRYLGLFKFQWFWTELEKDRVIPKAELMGFRFDIKPLPFLEIGLARTYMLGGEGSGVKGIGDLNFNDWLKLLFTGNAQDDLNTNQIGGIDVALYFDNIDRWVHILKSIELWGEWYGEDESGGLPSDSGFVVGLKFGDLFLTGRTDLIFEFAENVDSEEPLVWYNHSIYQSGYRYEGDVMGHNMDTEARDYFIRLNQYITPDLILGLDYNRQERRVHQDDREDIDRVDVDLTWQRTEKLRVQTAYRYENINSPNQTGGTDQDNHIFRLFMDYSF